jgi:hypothetical protein
MNEKRFAEITNQAIKDVGALLKAHGFAYKGMTKQSAMGIWRWERQGRIIEIDGWHGLNARHWGSGMRVLFTVYDSNRVVTAPLYELVDSLRTPVGSDDPSTWVTETEYKKMISGMLRAIKKAVK